MSNLIKSDALELGNFILMCYQDVLKALEDIKLGIGPPWWFNLRAGTCVNVGYASVNLYGVVGAKFDKAQRLCLDVGQVVKAESKLDYVLTQMWMDSVKGSDAEKFTEKACSRIFPIIREFKNDTTADSYFKSVNNRSLYQGEQLEARIHLVKFKCDTLSKELKLIWKSGVTSKDFKTVLEELEKLEDIRGPINEIY